VLKLNEEELPVVRDLLGLVSKIEEIQIRELIHKYSLKLVALTKGGEGSLLVTPADSSFVRTPDVDVKDSLCKFYIEGRLKYQHLFAPGTGPCLIIANINLMK